MHTQISTDPPLAHRPSTGLPDVSGQIVWKALYSVHTFIYKTLYILRGPKLRFQQPAAAEGGEGGGFGFKVAALPASMYDRSRA